MTPPCKSLVVFLATALTGFVHLISASPFLEGTSIGSAGYGATVGAIGGSIGGNIGGNIEGNIGGNIGGGYGEGIFRDDCSTDVPVQPTVISPETDFLPVTNVLPQVSDDGGGDLGYGGYGGSTFGYGGGAFGYGRGIGVYGY